MLKLDHIVVKVRDLEWAISEYQAQGFTVTQGGEHPMFGSVNALVPFEDDTYIELIAFPRDMHPDATRSAPGRRVAEWRQRPYGPIDWALVPDDINAEIARLRAAGQTWDDPVPGQRLRTDGQLVQWWFGTPDTFLLPFLCADVTPRDLRVPPGAARQHQNGAVGVYEVLVNTHHLLSSLQQFKQLFREEDGFYGAGTVKPEESSTTLTDHRWTLELTTQEWIEGLQDVFIAGFGELPVLPEEEKGT
jgi:hypothetical protein